VQVKVKELHGQAYNYFVMKLALYTAEVVRTQLQSAQEGLKRPKPERH
jgi:hypothetical protein